MLGEDRIDARRVGHVADHGVHRSRSRRDRRDRWRWRTGCSRSARRESDRTARAHAICRHSSEPIEPPAPVTSTRLPLTSRRRRPVFSATWLRGSRSSIASGRICLTRTWPLTSSDRLGSVVIGTLKSSSRCTKPRTVAGVALGMATSASPGLRRRDDAGQIRPGAEHLDAVNRAAELRPVVVDEADGLVAAALPHLPHDHVAGIAGADDQHASARSSASRTAPRRHRSACPPRKQTAGASR